MRTCATLPLLANFNCTSQSIASLLIELIFRSVPQSWMCTYPLLASWRHNCCRPIHFSTTGNLAPLQQYLKAYKLNIKIIASIYATYCRFLNDSVNFLNWQNKPSLGSIPSLSRQLIIHSTIPASNLWVFNLANINCKFSIKGSTISQYWCQADNGGTLTSVNKQQETEYWRRFLISIERWSLFCKENSFI